MHAFFSIEQLNEMTPNPVQLNEVVHSTVEGKIYKSEIKTWTVKELKVLVILKKRLFHLSSYFEMTFAFYFLE